MIDLIALCYLRVYLHITRKVFHLQEKERRCILFSRDCDGLAVEILLPSFNSPLRGGGIAGLDGPFF